MPQQFHSFISSQEKMHVHTKTCMQMFINYSPKLETFYMFINCSVDRQKCYRVVTATAKSLQSCPTLCDPTDGSPPGSPVPGIFQARTRVGCHFLLQCMKVKSESEVAQSCLTLHDPMDCSLPGSSVHGIFQARVLLLLLLLSHFSHGKSTTEG